MDPNYPERGRAIEKEFGSQNLANLMMEDETDVDGIWRMYNRAKDSLPFKNRIENLTWRMMYLRQKETDEDNTHPDATDDNGNNKYSNLILYNKSSSASLHGDDNIAESNMNMLRNSTSNSPNLNPVADEFDYVAHIRKMGQVDNANESNNSSAGTNTKKRPAPFSPAAGPQSAQPSLQSNLSLSLKQSQRQGEHHDSGFEFYLDPLAFDGPSSSYDIPSRHNFEDWSLQNNATSETTIGPQSVPSSSLMKENSFVNIPDQLDRSLTHTPAFHHTSSYTSVDNFDNFTQGLQTAAQSPNVYQSSNTDSYFDNFNNKSFQQSMMYNSNTFSNGSLDKKFSNNLPNSLPAASNMQWLDLDDNKPLRPINKRTKSIKSKKKSMSPDPSKSDMNANTSSVSCTNCHTKTTPLWRRNPQGQPLCNACGLFLKLHGVVRPLSLKTDVIKKRQRGSNTTKKSISGNGGSSSKDGDDLNPTSFNKDMNDMKMNPSLLNSAKKKSRASPSPTRRPTTPNFFNVPDTTFSNDNISPNTAMHFTPKDYSNQHDRQSNNHPTGASQILSDDFNLHPIHELDHEHEIINHLNTQHPVHESQHQSSDENNNSNNNWDWLSMTL